MKSIKIPILLAWFAVGLIIFSACVPAPAPAPQNQVLPAKESTGSQIVSQAEQPAAEPTAAGLIEIAVDNVTMEFGFGSPGKVEAVIAGTWPGLCSQLAEVRQQTTDTNFDIHVLASPDTPGCRPDQLGLPFRLAVPLNMVEKPAQTYTVSVNGVSTTFNWDLKGPAPTPIPTEVGRFSYEGVSFVLDGAVAASASGERIAANLGTADGPYWEVAPEHVKISLSGYPISGVMHEPVIYVYPVGAFRRLSEQVDQEIDDLQYVLAGRKAGAEGNDAQIPFLPIWNAAQSFHSNAQYLGFENGIGVRYLAVYAQYPAPVNNHDLFYTFQGLTADGRYMVSVIMPVSHPSLPARAEALSTDELQSIAGSYDDYRVQMSTALQELPNDTFTPDLWKLDQMIMSLRIE